MSKRKKVKTESILQSLPPVISPQQLATAIDIQRSTVYEWIAKGRLDGCFRKRGKHNLLVTEATIEQIFNGPDWSNEKN